jgi:hypothetical protein
MRTLALPKTAEPWSLTSLREKLIKIGAKVVSHGRYVTFQLAEVAVPRQDVCRHPVADRPAASSARAGMTGAEVRYGDGTMGEVRLVAGKTACFGAPERPKGGYDAMPDTQHAICRCSKTPKGAILPSNEPEIRRMSA